LLDARGSISAAHRNAADIAIVDRALRWFDAAPVATLGVFWPMRGEPDLRPLYAALAARGVRLALPVVDGADLPLRFVGWTPGDMLVKDGLGVMVPAAGETLTPAALLIPCLGFNAQRMRLGYGGGFYDRTLAAVQRPQAIGIAYASSKADFAGEAHDVALDLIITEES
jgi:5-formyltetrahydrofolate cyclo-ligase